MNDGDPIRSDGEGAGGDGARTGDTGCAEPHPVAREAGDTARDTEPLRLAEPEAGLMSGQLAARLGVGGQTIRNWAAAGMPSCGKRVWNGVAVPVYNFAACEAWARLHRGASLHGGRRHGAGRKPAKDPDAGALVGEIARAETLEERRVRAAQIIEDAKAGRLPPMAERLSFDNLASLTADQLRVLASVDPDVSGFSPNQATRLQQLARAQRDEIEIAEQRGMLLEREEVEAAITKAVETCRTNFEGLTARLVPAFLAAMRLPAEKEPAARQLVQREVEKVCADLERAGRAVLDGQKAVAA